MFFGNSSSDFGFLPPNFKGDVQVFAPHGTNVTAALNWQNWTKPRGTSMVYMLCIGGGGAGGAGHSAASGNQRGGGGGGGSGALTSLMLASTLLPDSLKIAVGTGGVGAPGAAGSQSAGRAISSISSLPFRPRYINSG